MNNFVVIIRGPIGVGKSTISELLERKLFNTVHVDVDKIKHKLGGRPSKSRTLRAHQIARQRVRSLIKQKKNPVIEEIFRWDDYSAMKKLIKNKNYNIVKVYLKASLDVLIRRDQTRTVKHKGYKMVKEFYKKIRPVDEDLNLDTSKMNKQSVVRHIIQQIRLGKS